MCYEYNFELSNSVINHGLQNTTTAKKKEETKYIFFLVWTVVRCLFVFIIVNVSLLECDIKHVLNKLHRVYLIFFSNSEHLIVKTECLFDQCIYPHRS